MISVRLYYYTTVNVISVKLYTLIIEVAMGREILSGRDWGPRVLTVWFFLEVINKYLYQHFCRNYT